MKIEDLHFYGFEPELEMNSKIICPSCNEPSQWDLWELTEVSCEDCGSHEAIRCPNCQDVFDNVYADDFKTLNT